MATKIQLLSLLDIARSDSFGPIRIGEKLSDFANEVGPPISWGDFSDQRKLSCIMTFGNVQVGLEGFRNDAIVTWAKFWMHGFERRRQKFAISEDGLETHLFNPFVKKFPSYGSVEKLMRENGVQFTSEFPESPDQEKDAIMSIGKHVKLYYSGQKVLKLVLVCLSASPLEEKEGVSI